MLNFEKLVEDITADVEAGNITEENAQAVLEAAIDSMDDFDDDDQEEETEMESVQDAIMSYLEAVEINAKNEIDESLPVKNPDEEGCICKQDIDIEDAKDPLDEVKGKLEELRAKHRAEEDTSFQHNVIKQTTADDIAKTKLDIYESYENGIIDVEEKAMLLSILEAAKDPEDDEKKIKTLKKCVSGTILAIGLAIAVFVIAKTLYSNSDAGKTKKANDDMVKQSMSDLKDNVAKLKELKKKIEKTYDAKDHTGNEDGQSSLGFQAEGLMKEFGSIYKNSLSTLMQIKPMIADSGNKSYIKQFNNVVKKFCDNRMGVIGMRDAADAKFMSDYGIAA